ncbi:MAG: hypothetical protein L0287_26710 [Anaerolineae bacterium]|nr:hypothetical protein [Anaerolineae bacterium]
MNTQTVPTNEQRNRQIKWQNWRSALYQQEQDTARYAAKLNHYHGIMMKKSNASQHANYHQDKIITQNEQANSENQMLWSAYQVAVTLDTRLKSCLTPSGEYLPTGEHLDYEACLQMCEQFMIDNAHQ